MTQFAVLTGPKPEFKDYEAVPLQNDCVKDYVGSALTDEEKSESWVLRYPKDEVIDSMCCDAQRSAQLDDSIENTELYKFLISYLPKAKAIVFFYATDTNDLPVFTEKSLFLTHINDSLSGQINPSMEVYAKYKAST